MTEAERAKAERIPVADGDLDLENPEVKETAAKVRATGETCALTPQELEAQADHMKAMAMIQQQQQQQAAAAAEAAAKQKQDAADASKTD